MQRHILGAALLALAATSVGCNPSYTAGRCDCQYNPANAVIAPASNPYPVIGANAAVAPATGSAPAMMPMTVPPVAIPPAAAPMTIPPATTGK